MVKFSLIDNGADSLKKAKTSIECINGDKVGFTYHHVKDATIFLIQAIEVLLKQIIKKQNESLIFKDIKSYMEAKKELINKFSGPVKVEKEYGFGFYPNSKYTIFDTKKGKNLTTITITEAIERVKYLCDIDMSEEFIGAIYYINDYRNKLMHHSIEIYSHFEIDNYLRKLEFLYDYSVNFFENHIPGITELIDRQRFEISAKEWEIIQRDMADFYQERAMSKIISDDMF